MVEVDHPYYTLGGWQNRAFAVPPAMGVDYRVVNGYVYISPNPVTDPAKMAERAEYFEKRAGHYFQNWDELYAGWRTKMEALNREVESIEVPDLPEYEPDEVVFGEQNLSNIDLLRAYSHTLRCAEMMWQHHFEFLLLGLRRLPDVRGVPAQRAAGHPRPAHLADGRRHRRRAVPRRHRAAPARPRWRSRPAWTAPSSEGRSPAEIDAELAESDAGRAWLDELEQIKDPWFNMGTGDGLYHYYGSWHDDPSIPYASLIGHIAALKAGQEIERPTEELAKERDRLAEEYGALLDEEARPAFQELLGLSRTVFPYVEEHKFYCDYWFQSRFFNKVREFGALLAKHGFLEEGEDIFNLSRHEAMEALEELSLTWSTGGPPLGPHHWPPIVARRKRAARAARRVDAAARPGRDAGGGQRPDRRDALGHHPAAAARNGRARRRAAS